MHLFSTFTSGIRILRNPPEVGPTPATIREWSGIKAAIWLFAKHGGSDLVDTMLLCAVFIAELVFGIILLLNEAIPSGYFLIIPIVPIVVLPIMMILWLWTNWAWIKQGDPVAWAMMTGREFYLIQDPHDQFSPWRFTTNPTPEERQEAPQMTIRFWG